MPGAPVAVAVVSWNTRELLGSCLRSLAGEAEAGLAEVWVVDNASTDGSAELVRDDFPWVHLIASARNLGFGPAVNLVAGRTGSPWIAPANADVELTPGALAALVRAAAEHPARGVVSPRLILQDGSTQHSVYPFPTVRFTALFNLGLPRLMPHGGDRWMLEGHWDPSRSRDVDWAVGAFLLVRRTAWEAIGGFDENQWMYAEDLDLGWRMSRAGYVTRYEPSSLVRHRQSAATAAAWGDARSERWMQATYAWMLARRGGLPTRAIALLNIAGALARAAIDSPGALLGNSNRRTMRRTWLQWARLHRHGLARRAKLEREIRSPVDTPSAPGGLSDQLEPSSSR